MRKSFEFNENFSVFQAAPADHPRLREDEDEAQ